MPTIHPTYTPKPLPFTITVRHLPLKRIFDIAFSFLVLTLGAPIFCLLSLCILATSRGGIFYAHQRIGRGGKAFSCYKFRTMYADADKRLEELLAGDPAREEEWRLSHKLKNDPRITPLGKFLRQTSLDELPQFWNVLLGDLSVVGPRPVVTQELLTHFGDKAPKILSVRPGLTGIWQVSGRNDVSYIQRIELDEHYIDTQSLWQDVQLICKTIPCMFFRRGAY